VERKGGEGKEVIPKEKKAGISERGVNSRRKKIMHSIYGGEE